MQGKPLGDLVMSESGHKHWRKAMMTQRLALKRIAARVREGGHDVPRPDVVRRCGRGWDNFRHVYCLLADV